MTDETVTIAGDGITASLLVWRRYRRPVTGAVEALLTANPGLAKRGHFIPVGTVVTMPVITPTDLTAAAVSLYD